MRFAFSILTTILLGACQVTTIAPAEQVQQKTVETTEKAKETARTVVKKQLVAEYVCEKSKVVSVQKSSNKKNATITVTFNQSSYKLSPNVTNRGKKYSNIRWIWLVDAQGIGTLTDNRHNILAQHCQKR